MLISLRKMTFTTQLPSGGGAPMTSAMQTFSPSGMLNWGSAAGRAVAAAVSRASKGVKRSMLDDFEEHFSPGYFVVLLG